MFNKKFSSPKIQNMVFSMGWQASRYFFVRFFGGFYRAANVDFLIETELFPSIKLFVLAKNLLASKTSIKTGMLFLVKCTTTLPISLA